MTLTVNKNNRIRLVSGGSGRAQKIMKTNNILKTVGLGLAISAFAACQAGAISSFQVYNTPSTTLGNQGAGGGFMATPAHARGDRGALALTVHDLAWRSHPEATTRRGRRWHEAALRRGIRRADTFVVPSAAWPPISWRRERPPTRSA